MTSGSLPRPVVGLLGPIVVFRHPPSGAAEPAGPARPPGPAGPPEPAEVPARLDRVVLAHLALAEGRAVTMDDLVEALWGEHPPRRARNAVQVKVSRLRGRLGEHGRALVHAQGSYRLALERHQVDAGAFSLLVREAEACSAAGDHQRLGPSWSRRRRSGAARRSPSSTSIPVWSPPGPGSTRSGAAPTSCSPRAPWRSGHHRPTSSRGCGTSSPRTRCVRGRACC